MESIFDNCTNLESLDLSSFCTKNIINTMYMLIGCKKLKYIDLSSFDFNRIENTNLMFHECLNLKLMKINKDYYNILMDIFKNTSIEIIKLLN